MQRLRGDDGEAPPAAAVFRGAATALRLADSAVAVARHGGGVEQIHLATRAATVALPRRPVQALSPRTRGGRSPAWSASDVASGAEEPFVRGERFAVDNAGRWASASKGRVTFGPGGGEVTVPALDAVQELLLSPDGERAFVRYGRSNFLVVDRAAGVVADGSLPVVGPAVALDGARLALWDHRAALTVYDAVAGAVTLKAKAPKRGAGVAFTALAAGGGAPRGRQRRRDRDPRRSGDGRAARAVERRRGPRARGGLLPADGARVATSADDPFVRTWEVAALLATPIATGHYEARRRRGPTLA